MEASECLPPRAIGSRMECCVEVGEYVFTMYDKFKGGMCCGAGARGGACLVLRREMRIGN